MAKETLFLRDQGVKSQGGGGGEGVESPILPAWVANYNKWFALHSQPAKPAL